MLGQFHADELCPYDWFVDLIKNKKYKLLLYKQKEGQEIVGYALMYPAKQANVVWLDSVSYTHLQAMKCCAACCLKKYGTGGFKRCWKKKSITEPIPVMGLRMFYT